MSEERDWSVYRKWHELLDALCVEQNHLDNMTLAARLCEAGGNKSQAAFEAALKNLRNWRQGIHVPQRRNVLLLAKLLRVDRSPALRERWKVLHAEARAGAPEETPAGAGQPVALPSPPRPRRRLVFVGVAAAFGVAFGVAFAFFSWPANVESAPDSAGSFEGIRADYVRTVTAKVGDALIIHGARGETCGPAPDWERASAGLPQLTTGDLTDGGVGTRYSRQCGGRVPARAILFTATRPGVEQISLYGDPVMINVQK